MNEATEELIKEIEKKVRARTVLLNSAQRDKDRELETYQNDMIEALNKTLYALKQK